jgi:hypothetical protein
MTRRTTHTTALAATIALFWVAFTGMPAAFASFASAPGAALPIGTATVQTPGGVTVSVNCAPPTTLTVTWTATTGTTPDGYSVSAVKNQTGQTRQNTVPGTATSTSFNIPNWTTFTVLIQAQHGSWTSAAASQSGTISCP